MYEIFAIQFDDFFKSMKELKEVLEWKIHMSCVKKYAFKNGHALKILKSTSLCLNDINDTTGKRIAENGY